MTSELLNGLNDNQRQAVLHDGSHLLVLAGPGSGKTRVLTHRIAHFVEAGARPNAILAVTFTNKAASEMRERLGRLMGEDASGAIWAGTFHSMCARMLRFEHAAAQLPRDFQIIDAQDAQRLVANIIMEKGLAQDRNDATSTARDVKDRISYAKNTLAPPSTALNPSDFDVYSTYEERLRKMKALDFDDLLVRALEFLSSGTAEAARWKNRFEHVLVDEFQDTNAVQLRIVQLFSENAFVTAVGDAAQSIYSWRGADHTGVTRFESSFSPSITIPLGENYRSTPEIVAVCQAILDAEEDAPYRLELSTENPSGAKVALRECDDDRDEASYIVSEIRRSKRQNAEHAVLVRTAAQTRSLEAELVLNRIPYVIVGGLKFYERAEIRDAIAYLRTAVYECDVISFARAVATPRRGVGEKTIQEIEQLALASGDLHAELESYTGRSKKGIDEFKTVVNNIAEEANASSAANAVAYLVEKVLKPHLATIPDSQTRVENLDQLIAAAGEFQKGITTTGELVSELDGLAALAAFLEHVALVSAGDDTAADCVQIMTMHAAKGREFPVVFVAGLEESILPHVRASNSQEELSEERRLFYVACSRAEKRLHLTYARQRFLFGQVREQRRSRFVYDVTHLDVVEQLRAPNRKAPWTDAHRSRPVGTGSWATAHASPPAPPRKLRENTAPSGPRLSLDEAAPGTRVTHPSFGEGSIVTANNKEVVIDFSGKRRTLSLELAPLTKL
jgi:DNA helicase-2/ATP-dependent DNA helicase PcrA